jgi:uncharacterized membrane protein
MIKHFQKYYLAYIIIISGAFGLFAAFTLLSNRIELYKNPGFVPPCNINPYLDCGKVMTSKWASLFGFPNTIVGLIEYPLAIFTGLIILVNKTNNKWLLWTCNALAGVGLFMNLVLLYISAYLIGSLCPWCLLSGAATSNIFFALLAHNLKQEISLTGWKSKLSWLLNSRWSWLTMLIYYASVLGLVYLMYYLKTWVFYEGQGFDPIFWKWGEK